MATINPLGTALYDLGPAEFRMRNGKSGHDHSQGRVTHRKQIDSEVLRRCAWEIGERKSGDSYQPATNHVSIASVKPGEGFSHWHILPEWVDRVAREKGNRWHHCRLVLRLYDVSYIVFNGLNANHIQDVPLPRVCGQVFFRLPRPGTWQLGEVGFLLRDGEFIPAARSQTVKFSPSGPSSHGSHAALLVDERWRIEEIGNLWEQGRILQERRQPRLRQPLRIGILSLATNPEGLPVQFVSELAAGQSAQGHEVHVFIPRSDKLPEYKQQDGVHYQPLEVHLEGGPLEQAAAFGQAAEKCLFNFPPFDLIHLHEWMAGFAQRLGTCPRILSLTSVEKTRRNGASPSPMSIAIEEAEGEVARCVDCILTPEWLRDAAVAALGIDEGRIRAFPMEGRLPNEWESPLDFGKEKMGIGVGPIDRLLLFVGPLEHSAGADLLIEALPVLLPRYANLRVAFAGAGFQKGHLENRARHLGVAHAVRLLGHVEFRQLTRLLRSAEALVLPSRSRVPFDDAVVDFARRAGRPVVTTHAGPAHLVRHEETGIVTYDNPGSMVWALDRVLGDPAHGQRMGTNGRRCEGSSPRWSEVANKFLELCATLFPELTETRY